MKKITTTINKAVLNLLYPLVQLLLRYEISHNEFSELTRRSYVDVAYNKFGLPNKKQTASRVSLITGLSRPEVARLAALNEAGDFVTKQKTPNRMTLIIGGWMSDPDFLDRDGIPSLIPIKESKLSFEELVYRYGRGVTPRAVLDELIHAHIVEKVDDNYVQLLQHGYIPSNGGEEKIKILLTHASDLLDTGLHNITSHENKPRLQRQITYIEVPDRVAEEFERLSHAKVEALIMEMNQWLSNKCKEVDAMPDEPTHRLGLGIYYFKNGN